VLTSGATYIIRGMFTGVGGNATVEQGHAACGCHNGCMCLVWMWEGGGCISHVGGGVLECMLQVNGCRC